MAIDLEKRRWEREPPEPESLLVRGPDGLVRGMQRIAARLTHADVELIIGIIQKRGKHEKSKASGTIRVAFLAGSDDVVSKSDT
jgi:hypothetical protein